MQNTNCRSWFLVILGALPLIGMGQSAATESQLNQAALAQTVRSFQQHIGAASRLYNGAEYPGFFYRFTEGQPYFMTDQFRLGTVVYDGISYPDILMLYDEVQDLLVVKNNWLNIRIPSSRVSSFSLGGRQFARIVPDSLAQPVTITAGFYQVLHQGKITVLAKEIKTIETEVTNDEGILRHIKATTVYFLKNGEEYFTIRRRKDLLRIFPTKRKMINDLIRSGKLNFKTDPEKYLVTIAAQLEQA
jgi:hypothetical protein